MITETIHWHDAQDVMPDDEATVLIEAESGLVGEGFHLDQHWFWASAGSVDENVVAWSDLPKGSKAQGHP
jgi:hypothetical protein